MKIFHEAPLSIFKSVQQRTDGDYALVHLFETHPQYLEVFRRAKERGREIILDNSIFELGKAFDAERFAHWVSELRPDWYIVPDCLEDAGATIQQWYSFHERFPELPGRAVGVVQGRSYDELTMCYNVLAHDPRCEMIAISFDYGFWAEQNTHIENKWLRFMYGRQHFLQMLVDLDQLSTKPHHLLGCALPQEFLYYWDRGWDWIHSVDTSNPVVHGIRGITYGEGTAGLLHKESQKLVELLDEQLDETQWLYVMANIEKFRRYCNG